MKLKLILFAILMLSFFTYAFTFKTKKEGELIKDASSYVIVELYTSQGCSSCPRADKVLTEIGDIYKNKNVIPLGFHVDYWDRLGWKDTFSQHKFSERQYLYGKRFKLNSVYTPQMIVNGVSEFNGGDKSKAVATINKSLKEKASIKLNGEINELGKMIPIDYMLSDINFDRYTLNAVLVKNKEVVNIKRGENSNKKIEYKNIVIDLKTVNANKNGRIILMKPKDYNKENYTIVLFLQENNNGPIISATKLSHS